MLEMSQNCWNALTRALEGIPVVSDPTPSLILSSVVLVRIFVVGIYMCNMRMYLFGVNVQFYVCMDMFEGRECEGL